MELNELAERLMKRGVKGFNSKEQILSSLKTTSPENIKELIKSVIGEESPSPIVKTASNDENQATPVASTSTQSISVKLTEEKEPDNPQTQPKTPEQLITHPNSNSESSESIENESKRSTKIEKQFKTLVRSKSEPNVSNSSEKIELTKSQSLQHLDQKPMYLIQINMEQLRAMMQEHMHQKQTNSQSPHEQSWGEIMSNEDNEEDEDPVLGSVQKPMEKTEKKEEKQGADTVETPMEPRVEKHHQHSHQKHYPELESFFSNLLNDFKNDIHKILQDMPGYNPPPWQHEHQILEKMDNKVEKKQPAGGEDSSKSRTVSANNQLPKLDLKLDKITIPTFDGDLTNWISFRDQFIDLVHKNDQVSSIIKFNILQSHLKGLALDAINGFNFSGDDYETAWTLVFNRYNKTDKIIDAYLRRKLVTTPVLLNLSLW